MITKFFYIFSIYIIIYLLIISKELKIKKKSIDIILFLKLIKKKYL